MQETWWISCWQSTLLTGSVSLSTLPEHWRVGTGRW
jgi:hypothetical protein